MCISDYIALLSKQFLHCNRYRRYFRIHILIESVCGDKAYLYSTLVSCFLLKGFHTSNDVSILFFAKSVIVFGVFHFTDGYDTISTIYNQVNLNGRLALLTAPCIVFMSDGIKSQALYNLPYMPQTYTFKSQSIPIVLLWSTECVAPKMFICHSSSTKPIVE